MPSSYAPTLPPSSRTSLADIRRTVTVLGSTLAGLRHNVKGALLRPLVVPFVLCSVGLLLTGAPAPRAAAYGASVCMTTVLLSAIIASYRHVRAERGRHEHAAAVAKLAAARALRASVQLLSVHENSDGSADVALAASDWTMSTLDQDGRTLEKDSFPEMSQVNVKVHPAGTPHLKISMDRGEFGTLTTYAILADDSDTHFKLSFPSCKYEVGPFLPAL